MDHALYELERHYEFYKTRLHEKRNRESLEDYKLIPRPLTKQRIDKVREFLASDSLDMTFLFLKPDPALRYDLNFDALLKIKRMKLSQIINATTSSPEDKELGCILFDLQQAYTKGWTLEIADHHTRGNLSS